MGEYHIQANRELMAYTTFEEECRRQFCLNGKWQFHPIPVPANYVRDVGEPPALVRPSEWGWGETPIYIPSPWNGNTWGNGRIDRTHAIQKYHPDSIYYPSYPEEWSHVEMG